MISILVCSANMSIVAAIFLIISRVLRERQSPMISYYSWLVVMIGFLIPLRPQTGAAVVTVNNPSDLYGSGMAASINPMSVITAVYLIGAMCYVVYLIIRNTIWNRTVMRFARSVPETINNMTLEIADSLEIRKHVEVYFADIITSPMMTGLVNPIILLPKREYGYDELRLIIKHELIHYKHHDLWIKLLLIICRIIHWFNPLMIVIGKKLEQECEYYCDMTVTAGEDTEMRKIYCESILNTVSATKTLTFGRITPAIATNFYSPKQGLKHRLQLILTNSKRLFIGSLVAVVLLTCISGFAIASPGSASGEGYNVDTSHIKYRGSEEDSEPTVSSQYYEANTV